MPSGPAATASSEDAGAILSKAATAAFDSQPIANRKVGASLDQQSDTTTAATAHGEARTAVATVPPGDVTGQCTVTADDGTISAGTTTTATAG